MAANRLRLNAEKTDYCGLGRGSVPKLSLADWLQRPSVQCSTETVSASDDVRVIGVTFSSDLSLDKHVTSVCSSGFHWLRQLRRVRRSLDMDSTKTLVHAFIASSVDNCNAILAGSPRSMTDKLQRMMNAAARRVTGTHKFDHGLSRLLHDDLHWLDVPERIQCKTGVTVHRCLQSKAPKYLTNCCTPVSEIASRRHLRSASPHHLPVPSYQLT